MHEFDFWQQKVKPALHHPPLVRAIKLQDKYNAGVPDVLVNVTGVTAWLELKYQAERPARRTTGLAKLEMGTAQRRFLEAWAKTPRSQAYVLLGLVDMWYLLPATVADHLPFDDMRDCALISGDINVTDLRAVGNYIFNRGLEHAAALVAGRNLPGS